ncbi:MAG: PQQ-binding-like beta-propeller repeat protein, partial [Leptolyngbyaceae cyanobacterium bins.59]|nr:PQQ-binding-like beta-propeller repeat protein [Leptolyngbyaceae cyanobacterium bins.59]
MGFILHRGGNQRFVLQDDATGGLVGLLFPGHPQESWHSFAYDYGTPNHPREITNLADFPELAQMPFFTIEYPGGWEFERAFQSPEWEGVRSLFGAAGKTIGYHYRPGTRVPQPVSALWHHTPPNLKGFWKIPAWGLWVNAEGIWTGNRDGLILAYNHAGEPINQFQLPKNSRSLAESPQGLYAACDDGQIYDLSSGKLPQGVYNARTADPSIYWDYCIQVLKVQGENIFILDIYSNLTCLTLHWDLLWQKKLESWQGWFLQADSQAVYIGHFQGVTCLDCQTGKLIWQQATPAPVLCGALWDDRLIVGTSDGTLYVLQKTGDLKAQTTSMQRFAQCEGAVYACTLTPSGHEVIAADNQAQIYRFSTKGDRTQMDINCGAILNLTTWGDRLYGVTTDGTLACFQDITLQNSLPVSPPPLPSPGGPGRG